MRRDVADRHAAGVEPQDLVVQARQPRLALANELGLEAAVAVARGLDLHGPQLGVDRLATGAVANVGAVRDAARRMPEVLGQLGAQRRLDHPARQLREQPAGPGDVFGLKALQCVLKRLGRKQAGEPVDRRLRLTRRVVGALRISL